ncbi:helicase [Pedobacter yulinensis]|uniref:Helicase n=1 Tax=Pedobacter yulinensis TaxID=2126353 RepID=A0A2T3HHS1_9SPHI|nr:DEAD/DEAH box helicase [Pedobacter yulinensis]PST81987.1 helicase [Pedobacter yulinensis]
MEFKEALARLGIQKLNNLQEQALAAFPGGKDLLVLSPTGSGKTLCFLLPLIRLLAPEQAGVQALVLVPSRELALQITDVFRSLQTGYKVAAFYGGHAVTTETNTLREPPALVIGTPGRIAFHFRECHINAQNLHTLVLDEFDKSLELGFRDEMAAIIASLPNLRQRFLTSATAGSDIPAFAGFRSGHILNFLAASAVQPDLQYRLVSAAPEDKMEALYDLLCLIGREPVLVFVNHREMAVKVSEWLIDAAVPHGIFHGKLEQQERELNLARFRNGSVRILVTTDLAARGLDIPEVGAVVHYQMPVNREAFTHRNGRTARMSASGTVYLVCTGAELPEWIDVAAEPLERSSLPPLPPPEWETVYASAGKKDKLSKTDLVGFFISKGGLSREDIGLIEVKDQMSFVAIKRNKVSKLLQSVGNEKIKNKRVRFEIAH